MGDPIEMGLVTSLAHPRGNITGVSARAEALNEKLLELLKECIPSASRIAVMSTPPLIRRYREKMEMAARSLRVRLQFVEMTSAAELEVAFETMSKGARMASFCLRPFSSPAMHDESRNSH